jgi:mannose-1-phosphate guanylyltransferase
VDDARPFGLVTCEADGTVRAFSEKPDAPAAGDISAGTYVLDPSTVRDVVPEGAASIERDLFPALIAAGETVVGRRSTAYWMDVGTLERYLDAVGDALRGRGPCRAAAPWLHPSAHIAADAMLEWSVVVCDGVDIGTRTRVARSVLMDQAAVGAAASVRGSIVGPHAIVGDGADVSDSILGEGAEIEAGVVVRDARVSRDGAAGGSRHSS